MQNVSTLDRGTTMVDDKPLPSDRIPNIPPGVDNWKISNFKIFPEPATLYALSPHMHLRGKDMKFILTYPDGREELVLDVPKYDFNWQLYYELATPLKIPAGSKLTAIAHYDNSPKNKWNPGAGQGSVLVRAELGRDVQPADPLDVGSAGTDKTN